MLNYLKRGVEQTGSLGLSRALEEKLGGGKPACRQAPPLQIRQAIRKL
jgi:hypothetical protein